MSSYIVLARKWRPAQFSDIVGQNHIVRTLNNAIRSNRVHQAYLFTGSRGIGKTSIARIFAKVLRCESVQEINEILKSCDACSNCKEITSSSSVDVIEIDGASNNGVEAVREIRENAKYMPSSGTRKIYIIDEVHMLTTAAFNALLKTLEEPPSHVVFIFATTEPHKIPATILSRCQRFDYRKVTLHQIQSRLTEIIQAEDVQAESAAISLLSRAAEGSMRDALSLLDQVIAFSGSKISIQSVRDSIGLIEGQTIVGILNGIFTRNPNEALRFIEQAHQQGHDLRVLTRSLIEFLHAVLLAKIGSPHSSALELSEDEWSELQAIAPLRTLEEIELFFQVLHQGLEWIARSPQPKIVLDVLVIKCSTAEALVCIDSFSKSPSPGAANTPTPEQKIDLEAVPTPFTHKESEKTAPPSSVPSVPESEKKSLSWEGFVDHVRKTRPLLASILEHATGTQMSGLDGIPGERMILIYYSPQEAYFREQLQSRVYQEQLSQLSKEYWGSMFPFRVELKNTGESLLARKEREQRERIESIKEKAQKHPIIMEARSLFGGEIGPIDVQEASQNADFSP